MRFELLFALGWIAFGALLLPALVYVVGVVLLGTYEGKGLVGFYGNLFTDLISGSWAAVTLVFGPYVILMLARVSLLGRHREAAAHDDDEVAAVGPSEGSSARSNRVEPRIGN
ncbi:MAG: hypothetical protein ABW034_16925 [Steroidobacteraceae bacterium]